VALIMTPCKPLAGDSGGSVIFAARVVVENFISVTGVINTPGKQRAISPGMSVA